MNYILYLAHGPQGYIDECRFSLLRLLYVYNLAPPADLGVVVYTDQPQTFEAFEPFFKSFTLEVVDAALLQKWIGGTGYVHRAKTEMIKDALLKRGGNVLFFDTDTYLTGPIEEVWKGISDGALYFHTCEGILDRSVSKSFYKWDRFLETATINYGSNLFQYDKNLAIWNSGVVGLSAVHLPLLDEVLLLENAIHSQFPKHIAEQVAMSYCFANVHSIRAAEHWVAHYWNLKEFRKLLQRFFTANAEESIPNLVKKVHHLDAMAMQQQKLSYQRLPFWQRLLHNLKGSAWGIRRYEKGLV